MYYSYLWKYVYLGFHPSSPFTCSTVIVGAGGCCNCFFFPSARMLSRSSPSPACKVLFCTAIRGPRPPVSPSESKTSLRAPWSPDFLTSPVPLHCGQAIGIWPPSSDLLIGSKIDPTPEHLPHMSSVFGA